MCEKCEDTIGRVARVLGRDESEVREIHDAIADDMERTNAEDARRARDALTSLLGVPVQPSLLGVERAYILITCEELRTEADGMHATVSMGVGGGLPEDAVEGVLLASVESWQLRGTGGVTKSGALVEWHGEKP